jgi:hypothetical protein
MSRMCTSIKRICFLTDKLKDLDVCLGYFFDGIFAFDLESKINILQDYKITN